MPHTLAHLSLASQHFKPLHKVDVWFTLVTLKTSQGWLHPRSKVEDPQPIFFWRGLPILKLNKVPESVGHVHLQYGGFWCQLFRDATPICAALLILYKTFDFEWKHTLMGDPGVKAGV